MVGWDEDSNAGRLTLTTSDGATYEVAPSAPELSEIAIGSRLDPASMDALRFAAARKAAAKKAMALLDRRFYSRRRLRLRLLQAEHAELAVERVLDQLVEQGVLDDARFAEAWCRDQLRRKPVGRRWLKSGLRGQGVDDAATEAALDACLPREEEEEACRRALSSRRYDLEEENNRARALRFLMSRGFPPGMARELVFRARERGMGEGH